MFRIRSVPRWSSSPLRLGVGIAAMVIAGCGGDSIKPSVTRDDPRVTYKVPPPPSPEQGKASKKPKGGGMSARELRNYKQKDQPGEP